MINSFSDKNSFSTRRESSSKSISLEDCEARIFHRFPVLKDQKNFQNYLSSYDFHQNENDLLDMWRDILNFLFESILGTFAISLNEVYEKTKIRNIKPIGLPNIITELVNRGEYILSSSLKADDYFKNNYSNIYKKETWGSWVKTGLVTTVKLPFTYLGIGGGKVVTTTEFRSDELLINKRHFHSHLEEIVNILSKILIEEDIEVLTKLELKNILHNSDLNYKDLHLDMCLNYLSKIKKLAIFKIKIENAEVDCVKLLHNEDDSVTEKDKAIINILFQLKKFDKKVEESMKVFQDCIEKAKMCLKNKNREQAANWVKKKNIYLNAYNHFSNLKMTLEQNLLDIKSMQSNQNVKNILEDVVKTSQKLNLNVEEFNNIAEKMKGQRDDLKEAKDLLNEYNGDNINDDSIDLELMTMAEQLKVEEKGERNKDNSIILDDFYQPSKQVLIDKNKSVEHFPSARQENKQPNYNVDVEDDELNKMLEELQK